jgi:hypothetical protein
MFIQAVVVGIVGAAFLGFAYWGILVVLQPGLDRVRRIIHGRSVAAVPMAMPVMVETPATAQWVPPKVAEHQLAEAYPDLNRGIKKIKFIIGSDAKSVETLHALRAANALVEAVSLKTRARLEVVRLEAAKGAVEVAMNRMRALHPEVGLIESARIPNSATISSVTGRVTIGTGFSVRAAAPIDMSGCGVVLVPIDPTTGIAFFHSRVPAVAHLEMPAEVGGRERRCDLVTDPSGLVLRHIGLGKETPQDLPSSMGASDDESMSKLRMLRSSQPRAARGIN